MLDFTDLASVKALWHGEELSGHIPDQTCREILLEIAVTSFKHEILLADRFLYKLKAVGFDEVEVGEVVDELDASSWEDRKIKILSVIPGLGLGETLGFGSADKEEKRRSLFGLYKVMNGWSGILPWPNSTRQMLEKLSPSEVSPPSSRDLDEAEYYLAHHYVMNFAEYFKRAPTLPYGL